MTNSANTPDTPDEPEESSPPVPQPDPQKGGGDSGDKPTRPTAVGTGGPDDEDFQKRIGDMRRYDLEEFDATKLNPDEIISWPIPELSFVRAHAVSPSAEIKPKQLQPQGKKDPNQLPPRVYYMEDALSGLHNMKANVTFYVHGQSDSVSYYMGISVPRGVTLFPDDTDQSPDISSGILKKVLQSVYNNIEIDSDALNSDQIQALIVPNTVYTGIVTGIPCLKSSDEETLPANQIDRIANEMQGNNFGILYLAVPIPNKFVSQEEFAVVDQMQRAAENLKPENKRRVKYYLELQDSYLKHIQLGTAIGSWQVGVYFFAADRSVFVRLQSLIRATFTDETSRPTPLRTHEMPGLKHHIEQFGLLRNQRPVQNTQSLLSYRFLTPLNSRILSAYVHLPAR